MNPIAGPEKMTPRDIFTQPQRGQKKVRKSSHSTAHEFSVTGNRNSIHIREPKDELFEVNELMQKKREDQNQSEFWIG